MQPYCQQDLSDIFLSVLYVFQAHSPSPLVEALEEVLADTEPIVPAFADTKLLAPALPVTELLSPEPRL